MPAKKAPVQAGETTCSVCRKSFYYQARIVPSICGSLSCRAFTEWTPEEWEAAARMAQARQTAEYQIQVSIIGYDSDDKPVVGAKTVPVVLTPLDKEALRRYPGNEQTEKRKGGQQS